MLRQVDQGPAEPSRPALARLLRRQRPRCPMVAAGAGNHDGGFSSGDADLGLRHRWLCVCDGGSLSCHDWVTAGHAPCKMLPWANLESLRPQSCVHLHLFTGCTRTAPSDSKPLSSLHQGSLQSGPGKAAWRLWLDPFSSQAHAPRRSVDDPAES